MAFVYEVSSLIWNASRLADPALRAEALGDVKRLLAPALPELPEFAVVELIREITDRAVQLYPDDRRMIASTSVEEMGRGKYHVMVASMTTK